MFIKFWFIRWSQGDSYNFIIPAPVQNPSYMTDRLVVGIVFFTSHWNLTVSHLIDQENKIPSYLIFVFTLPCLNCLITLKCLISLTLLYWKSFLSFFILVTWPEKFQDSLEVLNNARIETTFTACWGAYIEFWNLFSLIYLSLGSTCDWNSDSKMFQPKIQPQVRSQAWPEVRPDVQSLTRRLTLLLTQPQVQPQVRAQVQAQVRAEVQAQVRP